jgi:hypothetical protein
MENLSLYQINEKCANLEQLLFDTVDTDTGEVNQEILQAYEAMQLTKEEKLKSCVYIIHKTEDNVELAKKEIARLKDFIAKNEKVDEKVRNLITCNIEPGKKLELGTVSIGWRKSTGLIVENEDEYLEKMAKYATEKLQEKLNEAPKEFLTLADSKAPYLKYKVVASLDKMAIKSDLKDGVEISGCKLDERENMQIK